MPHDEQDAKNYAELMKNIKNYCDDNINSKTKSILVLIEKMTKDFETDQDLSIYVNDVKISQFVMNEIYTTNWTNEEIADFVAKTRSVIQSFKEEDEEEDEEEEEEEIYADGYDYVSLMEKIVAYCTENSNKKTKNMIALIETNISDFTVDNTLTEERSLYMNHVPLYNAILDKMDSDDWTDDEKTTMFVNTVSTIPGFCNGEEIDVCDLCDGVRIM
jgi:hypothetical protein